MVFLGMNFFFSFPAKTPIFRFGRKTQNKKHTERHTTREKEEGGEEEEDNRVVMSSGARTTRAQKRRMGERDLWGLVVNDDDICFKHILPRLNGTDLKFLYEVNSETRKLVKRSTRAGDLKKRFKVNEMSSISTLEFAWEN